MTRINRFYKVSSYAPTQWVGLTDDNQGVYIRYRNNSLEVILGSPPVKSNSNSKVVFDKEVELDGHSGQMKSREMVNLLDDASISIDYNSESLKFDEELKAVWDNMGEYIKDMDVGE